MRTRNLLTTALAVAFLFGCASGSKKGPVKTDKVKLSDTRSHIENQISDASRQAKLLQLTEQLGARVQRLNDFDAVGLSRMAILTADYDSSDSVILDYAKAFRERRTPIRHQIAETLFAMKTVAAPEEWGALGRVALNDTIQATVIKQLQPEA